MATYTYKGGVNVRIGQSSLRLMLTVSEGRITTCLLKYRSIPLGVKVVLAHST